jgi:putrescine aminotransferase
MSPTATPVSHTTAYWQDLDRQHYLHPFTDFKSLHARGARVIVRAEGCYLYDSEGERMLDGMAGLWCVNVGYGRRELADVAYRQMLELPYYNSFFQTSHPPAIELARRLVDLTPPQFNRVFFTGSGSEGNDTVLRIVRRYWEILGQPERKVVVSRVNAYHGSTIAGASLGGMGFMHEQGGLPIPDIVHIPQPYWYADGGTLTPAEFGRQAAQALERKIVEVGPHRVAAFIGEPIQGAGGVIIPPDTYWPAIQDTCRRHGILLVSDEVVCGFGRTGRWFGCEHFDFQPDLMTIAKGLSSGYLPIGGVMVSDKIAEVLIDRGGEFAHGFTYSGHPVACAVASANLAIIERENLVTRTRDETGPYLAARWRELAGHPLVGEARSVGLIGALELVKDKATRTFFDKRGEVGTICRDFCFQNGLVMRATRDTMIISPPLVITREQIDELAEKTWRCLDLTYGRCRDEGRL